MCECVSVCVCVCVCVCECVSVCVVGGEESVHVGCSNAPQLRTCNYFVGSCGPTHFGYLMNTSTTLASRYGSSNLAITNKQKQHLYWIRSQTTTHLHVQLH